MACFLRGVGHSLFEAVNEKEPAMQKKSLISKKAKKPSTSKIASTKVASMKLAKPYTSVAHTTRLAKHFNP